MDPVQLETVWDRENVFAVSCNIYCGEDKGSYQRAGILYSLSAITCGQTWGVQ